MIKMKYIKIEQPIGTLYYGCMTVKEILSIAYVNRRDSSTGNGIQRKLDKKRLRAITLYSESSDAIFPTPIILAGKSKYISLDEHHLFLSKIDNSNDLFSIVDGQHRLFGINESTRGLDFQMPVAIILNTTTQEEAHLFSVINGNQKPVSRSLIYDLFSHADKRSFERTGHIIAQELNSDKNSPFYNKLKMLGYVEENRKDSTKEQIRLFLEGYDLDQTDNRYILRELYSFLNSIEQDSTTRSVIEYIQNNRDFNPNQIIHYLTSNTIPTLSQGIFIDILLEYITTDVKYENLLLDKNLPLEFNKSKKLIFRDFFNTKQDNMIYKILRSYFNAVRKNFFIQWESNKHILSKSTGYMALMMLLADIFEDARQNDFSDGYFDNLFLKLSERLPEDFEFLSENFGSSKSGAAKLYKTLKDYI